MENCILTNMCMVYNGNKVLVQNRRKKDWAGIVFPGGHVLPQESFVSSVIREIKEETGLDILNPQLCGIKQVPKENGTCRYIVLLYKTNEYTGTISSSDEGEVFWVDKDKLMDYPLAEGFEIMLEVFENDRINENYHWYDQGKHYQINK